MATARSMRPGALLFLAAVAVAAGFLGGARAEDHDVGGDAGWIVPRDRNMYADWVRGKTFRVGDELEFDFQTGQHDVTTVTKESYDSCTKTNFLSQIITGPAKVRLNRTGTVYFICTVDSHCSLGQKVAITVTGPGRSGGGSGSRAPAPAPNTTSPSPGTGAGTGTTSPPSPPSSAAAPFVGGSFAVLASLVLALFW